MAGWRYIAARLHGDGTETIIHPDVPLQGPSITKVLSGPNQLVASLKPADYGLIGVAQDGLPVLEEWSTAIFAEEDGVIHAGAILTEISENGPELRLNCLGFTGAIKDQPYQGSAFFVETEVLDIARAIWDHWQSMPGGNLGLTLDRSTKTGTKIGTVLQQVEFDTASGPVAFEAGPYKLTDYLTNDLGGAIDSLATDHGFDYRERHAWNADRTGFNHYLDFGAPRIGTRRKELRFVVGENVTVVPDKTTEADAYASAVLVRGAGDGPAMKRAFVPRANETRLRRVQVFEDKQLKSDKAVRDRGNSLLRLLTGRADVSSIVVADHAHAPLGSWVEGDEIEVFIDGEWGTTSMWVRILSTTINPEAFGVATLSVIRADKIPT